MLRFVPLVPLLVLVACGRPSSGTGAASPPPATPSPGWNDEQVAAEVAIARSGCVRCHAAPTSTNARWAPVAGPALAVAAAWRRTPDGGAFLRQHHGGDAAADLHAYVASLAPASTAAHVVVSPAALERGDRLVRELACQACHAPADFAGLAARTDHATLAAFLQQPDARRPGLVHPPLSHGEAVDIATALLRAQAGAAEVVPGFARTAWLVQIETEEEPDLAGREPHSQAIVDRIDAEQPPRENHFALRFDATIDVPAAGEWTFTLGSDDSSWLWIDGDKVIQNQGLAPHRRRSGKVKLTAGKHDLRVLFTEAAGGQSLELLWRGPGVDEQTVPKSVATAATVRLQPPPPLPAPEAAAVARGRAAARAARCDACHAIDDAAFAALPAPAAGKPFAELRDAACPSAPAGQSLAALGKDLASRPWAAPERLAVAFVRDGCGSCHVRDGKGGLPAPVRAGLAEVEDLGDEGRVPPDLTAVGRRLRPAWLQKVLATGHSVRPYLRVRMPALGEAKARDYAELFTTVDAAATTVAEPPFSVEAARRGRDLAGVGGRNCVTCHTFQGLAGPGIQGMDLALQYERLNPAWFRDWLLHPTKLRPGTRMPSLWLVDDAEARAEADAIRCWSSLGASAPLPAGLRTAADSLELVASDRPKLHGAFLEGISARCLAVGTPERTHFAFDLVEPRLVWAWRGAFLDGAGTWVGRAGKLVKPLGGEWLVLADFSVQDAERRELLGQRRTADGYPVLQVRAGDVEYEDEVRARLGANGSELVRTLRVQRGPATFVFPMPAIGMTASVDGVAASRHVVAAGQTLEVVYQW